MKKNNLKKLAILGAVATVFVSCNNGNMGQLTGVPNRPKWYQADPYGTVYIPMGSFNMGPSDQDVPNNFTQQSKTVSVQAFYMDQTEITNNEYRQFVAYVKDSMARQVLGDNGLDADFFIQEEEYEDWNIAVGTPDPPLLNYRTKIKWDDVEQAEILEELYYPPNERFYSRREIDTRKLIYEYYWIDYKAAANNRPQGLKDRSVFIRRDKVGVYPDTLVWIADFTYSYNEPLTKMYFWHPAYDDYPVVGITWKQANAFSIWRTNLMNQFLTSRGDFPVHDFRLPTEAEWEYAARGGLDLSPYPWGGPYIRNSKGCFLGNFKPLRGNYIDDGGFHTVPANSYNPNEYGLYCMAGNVAEWCRDAFEESGYSFSHDLNPDLYYEAKDAADGGVPALRRKVIRGGSWKDIGFYLQVSSRSYEYQDSCKSYIGFRNVQTFMGRAKEDYK
ncbi:MAG: SUMF1/EgtB/PvdO family nonheme iron enzyme [Flavobacteriales bacterium]|nr:SUMF1/EgtB/PvdO family nonheme iron enzyme [Flavobacteriales bacterium]